MDAENGPCKGNFRQPIEEDVCKLEAETGPCRAGFRRYFFNHRTGQCQCRYFYNHNTGWCEEFTYGGCGGNKNNFVELDDCIESCVFLG
jgi:hypothetical protein